MHDNSPKTHESSFVTFYRSFTIFQKKRATLASTETLLSVFWGQFLLKKDVWGLAKNLPLEY